MLLRLLLVLLILAPAPLGARERLIPQEREQVQLSYAPLVKKVAPAVVNIYTERVVSQRVSPFMGDPFFDQFFGNHFGFGGINRQRIENALGSGVIVDPDGLIVTNAHVVGDADEITVVLPDGREFEASKALIDEPTDIALLRIDAKDGDPLPYAGLRPSETLEVGDLVLAIGNPFGVGQTVTGGIVSALARSSLDISDFNFFIQTDAAINPGNSGGALVAMDGGIVGINTAIYSRSGGSMGLGFAIPSEMVAAVIAAEKAGHSSEKGIIRPWLGISAQAITSDVADNLKLESTNGVLISDLHESSPVRKAGIKVGDAVLAVNGKTVRDPAEMKFRMATVALGSETTFDVYRDGKSRTFKVRAVAPPEDPPRQETVLDGYHPLGGATVANINPAVAVELGLSEEDGVVVVAVGPRGRAVRVFSPGDVILAVNDTDIDNVDDLQKALDRDPAPVWTLLLSRDGRKRQIVIR